MVWSKTAACVGLGIATAIGLGGRLLADDAQAGFKAIANYYARMETENASNRMLLARETVIGKATIVLDDTQAGRTPARSICQEMNSAAQEYREQAERYHAAFNSRAERGDITADERTASAGVSRDLMRPDPTHRYGGNYALADKICNKALQSGFSPS